MRWIICIFFLFCSCEVIGQDKLPEKTNSYSAQYGTYFPLDEMIVNILLYFEIENNGKAAVLYEINQELHYVFLKKDNKVEFYFPQKEESNQQKLNEKKVFTYDPKGNKLTFQNVSAQYQIYETEETVGIIVQTRGKTYDLNGVKSTAVGSLKKLKAKLINVVNEPF